MRQCLQRRTKILAASKALPDGLLRPDGATLSAWIDRLVMHPALGLPIFLAVMWLIFQTTTHVSVYYLGWIEAVFSGPVTRWAVALLSLVGLSGTWVESLIVNGIIAGVGGVLVFVPVLGLMHFSIGLLEDSGYMTRAAYLVGRFTQRIGLRGKSCIPMLLGFSCSVPAICATRTLESKNDRLLISMLVLFLGCRARMAVHIVIATALFGRQAGMLIFAMLVLGIVVAGLVGFVLRRSLLRGQSSVPVAMALPPYRLPSLKGVLGYTWERLSDFIKNATSIILVISMLIWLLGAIPVGAPEGASFAQVDIEHSALAATASLIAPAFQPAGFGTWQASSALMTSFIAYESIISTFSQVYVGPEPEQQPADQAPIDLLQDLREIGLSFLAATWDTVRALISLLPGIDLIDQSDQQAINPALVTALRGAFTPLSAVAFSVFVLLTVPCAATLTALRQEFGLKWAAFSVVLTLTVSWMAAVLVYQGGLLLGFG